MAKTTIVDVDACEILDSRGRPTVSARVVLACGAQGEVGVPSGASKGSHEVAELRDGGDRYQGRGTRSAVRSVQEVLRPALLGMDGAEQQAVDERLGSLDPSRSLSTVGGNAALAVSVAAAVAAAAAAEVELFEHMAAVSGRTPTMPLPMVNVISGGAHAGGVIDVQDFLVVPVAARSFAEAIEMAAVVREGTAACARDAGYDTALVADEGGLGLALGSNRAALELLTDGIARGGLRPGVDAAIAIDVAASQLYQDGRYHLASERRNLDAHGLRNELTEWVEHYPVVSIEDALAEDDWEEWVALTESLGDNIQLIGDDLFATDTTRLERGVRAGAGNSVLVKPNQVGTLTGAARVVQTAVDAGYATVVSARSGETEDHWLADLAVGWGAGQIKVGSTTRSERTAKWNRLLRLESRWGSTLALDPFPVRWS